MTEEFLPYNNEELIARFEEMVKNNETTFFDVDQFEAIIDHYFERNEVNMLNTAVKYAMEQHPANTMVHLKRARLLMLQSRYKPALKLLNDLEEIEPANTEIYYTKASLFSYQKQYKDAVREYEKALLAGEEPDEIYMSIAFEYENMSDYAMAIKYLKKVLRINPMHDSAIYELSFCF